MAAAATGTVRLHGRPVTVRLSQAAARLIAASHEPLLAEMELYFSCLVRKRVRFRAATAAEQAALPAGPGGLRVALRTVAGRACAVAEAGDAPPLETLPVVRPEAFVPRWLRVDARDGRLAGAFGFAPEAAP